MELLTLFRIAENLYDPSCDPAPKNVRSRSHVGKVRENSEASFGGKIK
jgi:hypothetical protein